MSAYVRTPSYALYDDRIRPTLAAVVRIVLTLSAFAALSLAFAYSSTQNVESGETGLGLILFAVGALGILFAFVSWLEDEDTTWSWATYPTYGAVACWIIIGIYGYNRDAFVRYDEKEIRVLDGNRILQPGETTRRSMFFPHSMVIDPKQIQKWFSIAIPYDKRLLLTVRYSAEYRSGRELANLVLKTLDKGAAPLNEVAQKVGAEIQDATTSLITSFVQLEGINSVGRDVPHTISYLGRIRIEEVTIRP